MTGQQTLVARGRSLFYDVVSFQLSVVQEKTVQETHPHIKQSES